MDGDRFFYHHTGGPNSMPLKGTEAYVLYVKLHSVMLLRTYSYLQYSWGKIWIALYH